MSLIRTGSLACFLAILAACASTAPKPGVDRVLVVGATGQTGRLLVADLRAEGFQVSAFVRDAERARKTLGDDVELYVGDVKDPASIAKAMQNADALVSAIGARGAKGPDRPEMIDYQGVKNLADAAAAAQLKHFVLLSSMGVTHEDNPLNKLFGNVLIWKGKGEQAVRDSGVPYTVIRPAGLVNEAAGTGPHHDGAGRSAWSKSDPACRCSHGLSGGAAQSGYCGRQNTGSVSRRRRSR